MKLNLVKKEKDSAEVEVIGETLAFVNAIKEELWNDPNVLEAAVIREHPYLANPKIWIKVKSGNPIKALKDAAKRLETKVKEMKKVYQIELK
ncbi:MAG: DNA-directed RNA polymerase subunit L [Candidatus Aenigmarchaeota archaeon]|nr:DNA-directed RNA polymerase subunit L [Candidatus Aenigmarchaeota archaeon]